MTATGYYVHSTKFHRTTPQPQWRTFVIAQVPAFIFLLLDRELKLPHWLAAPYDRDVG